MTTPERILFTPTIKLEIEIALQLQKFEQQQKADGRAEETIRSRLQSLKQVAMKCNINEPEEVKIWLSNYTKWNNKTKTKFADTYSAYLNFTGKKWTAPKYTVTAKLPFIPTEQEIDLLISACGKQTSAVLQTLKETGIRIGELTLLKWIDLDGERKTLNITPEKGSNPRILPISDKLLAMINKLPHNRETIFQPRKHMLREYFCTQRKEIAERLQNQRLKKITFHTFRHWKGTMEYHKTKDIMHVKYVLGHKTINCTLIYINLEETIFLADTDEWIVKVAHNEAEEIKLIEASFTFVNKRENGESYSAFYKKRK